MNSTAAVAQRVVEQPADTLPLLSFIDPEQYHYARAAWWPCMDGMLIIHERICLVVFRKAYMPTHAQYLDGELGGLPLGHCAVIQDSLRAETALLYAAAMRKVSPRGLDMYLVGFPDIWPGASIVAESGIKRLLYTVGGPSGRDAAALRSAGVELVRVV